MVSQPCLILIKHIGSCLQNTHSLIFYPFFFWLSVSTKQEKIININQECGQFKKLLIVINWYAT